MNDCFFYALALVPDLKPERVKFGVAKNVTTRVRHHRTAAPGAELLGFWPCDRNGEREALAIAASGGTYIGGEVYDVDCARAVVSRLSDHFTCEPRSVVISRGLPSAVSSAFPPPPKPTRVSRVDDWEEFKAATDIYMEWGVTLATIAKECGVSTNAVSRARSAGKQHRPPPKGWRTALERVKANHLEVINQQIAGLHQLIEELDKDIEEEERAAALSALAAELADA